MARTKKPSSKSKIPSTAEKPAAPTGNDAARAAALAKLQAAKPEPAKDAAEATVVKPVAQKGPKAKPAASGKMAARKARTPGEPRAGGLTAAHQVLLAAKEPMRIRDITKAAIDRKLWSPDGKTPWATLAAAIGREIKDKGKLSRFKKTDRGLFSAVKPR